MIQKKLGCTLLFLLFLLLVRLTDVRLVTTLNLNPNGYEIQRIDDAYAAAIAHGNFQFFYSFDMSYSWDAHTIASIVEKHATSPATYQWNGKVRSHFHFISIAHILVSGELIFIVHNNTTTRFSSRRFQGNHMVIPFGTL